MQPPLKLYNTLTRQKEVFTPINPPFVGMYVCGPTVYSNVHLGNVRTFTFFDVLYRYLSHLGHKVRYVRNITDVGHLTDDADDGEDKIGKKARIEQLEPMEVVQRYTNDFHAVMAQMNNLPPSVEPTATGHLLEQMQMVSALLDRGVAYESNGSVYFDVMKYNEQHNYGILSGRKLEELMAGQRELDGQEEKRNRQDFAVWKKAAPSHIMQWDSPWGKGFPGWHLECSVMSHKYLGKTFDIHGGGMDLQFPHHECEIAQGTAANGEKPVNYWLHTNMLTVNGQRMGKSVGNAIMPSELFAGSHPLLEQAYSPMTLRFAMLQAHYRSTMDLSNEALKAAAKGYRKLMNGMRVIRKLRFQAEEGVAENPKLQKQLESIINSVYRGMNDDMNTAVAIAGLFNLLKKINNFYLGNQKMGEVGEVLFNKAIHTFEQFVTAVFGLLEEKPAQLEKAIDIVLEDYRMAKAAKDYDKVDAIRGKFKEMGLAIQDRKEGIDWSYAE